MAHYEQALRQVRYRNWRPATLSERRFRLTCSELNGRYTSNEFNLEVSLMSFNRHIWTLFFISCIAYLLVPVFYLWSFFLSFNLSHAQLVPFMPHCLASSYFLVFVVETLSSLRITVFVPPLSCRSVFFTTQHLWNMSIIWLPNRSTWDLSITHSWYTRSTHTCQVSHKCHSSVFCGEDLVL